MTNPLLQPLAVVSGASSGIGAAVCKLLAQKGWRVVMIARGKAGLDKVAAQLPAGTAIVMACDASDPASITTAAEQIVRHHGVPDVVINSAGAGVWRFIEETSASEIQQMMNAPFMAAYQLSRAFMKPMLERRRGLIIQVNSPVSLMGWPGATGYMAVRWAMRGLHEALRLDLHGTGVRSSHILFGKVSSEYFVNNPGSEERLPAITKLVPVISPEKCAEIIFKTIQRPRHEVIYPFMLRAFAWLNWLAPWAVRTLAVQTGRKHQ